MRNNAMLTGMPPGLTIPPPGLCLPPEQIPMGTSGATQYVHLGFPSMNHMPPWTGQVMMGSQLMYHASDILAYPPSPLVSRQSSPSQSRSPSRSNSPMSRSRTNANNSRTSSSQVLVQSTSNALTMPSTSGSNIQTSMSGSSATNSIANNSNNNNNSLPPLPMLGASRSLPSQQPPLLPSSNPRSISLSVTNPSFSRHNNVDNNTSSSVVIPAVQQKQAPPPLRLRSSNSGDSLRETLGKEMPNFKGNLQNFSLDEVIEVLLLSS